MEDLRTFSVPLSKYSVATCAMFYHLIPEAKLKKGLLPLGPVFRLLSNFEGQRGKQYLPQERCGEDVELAANRMPAYWERMRADESNSLAVAVASPPVMCWICGGRFLGQQILWQALRQKAWGLRRISKEIILESAEGWF